MSYHRPFSLFFKIIMVLFIGVLYLHSVSIGSPKTPSFNELIKEARLAKDAGNYEEAIALLKRAHKIKATPVLINNIGKMYSKLGRYKEAVDAYRIVTDDPNASQEVRTLDEQRIGKLEPKLSKAWGRVEGDIPWTAVWVGGQFCPLEGQVEVPVRPGTRWVELKAKGGHRIRLRQLDLPMGRRTSIKATTFQNAESMATLRFEDLDPRPVELQVNGLNIESPSTGLNRLDLPAGTHVLRLMNPAGRWVQLKTTLRAAQEALVSKLLPSDWKERKSAYGTAPVPGVYRTTQILAAGLGATLITSGLYLFYDVEQSRAYVLDETQSPSMTMKEADERWRTLNNRATLGGILTGIGSAVVIGAGTWWWLGRSKGQAPATTARFRVFAPWCDQGGCGLEVGGAFE